MSTDESMKKSSGVSSSRLLLIGGIAVVVIALVVGGRYLLPKKQLNLKDPVVARAVSYMKSDLKGIVGAEVLFHDFTGRYTADPDSTAYLRTFGVDKPTILVTATGFTARITHPQAPGISCAVAVGMSNPYDRKAAPGVIVCQ